MVSFRHFVSMVVIAVHCAACNPSPESAAAERYSVVVVAYDTQRKITGIKALREETGLGLADAKHLIESSPGLVKSHLSKSDAEALAARLREPGITVEVRAE